MDKTIENNLHKDVRQNLSDYLTGETKIGKYVNWSLYETVETIDAYINSKHISGSTDSLGRDKPFFNIVTAAANIWFRATDIDRKDIKVKPKKIKQAMMAFIANLLLQDWMNKNNFGQFLNNWGRSLAKYGSSVVKFVEKDGELVPSIIPWNRLVVDSVDFYSDIVIEKLYYTPAQLRKNKSYNQDVVKELIASYKTARKDLEGLEIDEKSNFIEVYEVHGEMPLSYLTEKEEDQDTYTQQIQVISYIQGNDKEFRDFTLFKSKEAKSPYMITHLIEEDGRTLGIGAVEHLFDSQWMVNHSHKLIKDQLDLASKLIFQTSDPNFVGLNVLNAIETGDILTHSPNQSLTQLANNSHDITALQNMSVAWKNNSNEIVSTPDAISGNTMPSGTAYRQVAVLNQEAHSLFEQMTENKGLALEQMIRIFIVPFLKKKMDTTDEIAAILDSQNIAKIDGMYIQNEATKIINEEAKKTILGGRIFEGVDENALKEGLQAQLNKMGSTRYFSPDEVGDKTWKDLLKDFEWEVEVEITNENSNKEVILTTLTTVLQSIAARQGVPFNPQEKLLFNKILEETGVVSSFELASVEQPNTQSPQSPNMTSAIPANLPNTAG